MYIYIYIQISKAIAVMLLDHGVRLEKFNGQDSKRSVSSNVMHVSLLLPT